MSLSSSFGCTGSMNWYAVHNYYSILRKILDSGQDGQLPYTHGSTENQSARISMALSGFQASNLNRKPLSPLLGRITSQNHWFWKVTVKVQPSSRGTEIHKNRSKIPHQLIGRDVVTRNFPILQTVRCLHDWDGGISFLAYTPWPSIFHLTFALCCQHRLAMMWLLWKERPSGLVLTLYIVFLIIHTCFDYD